MVLYTIHCPKCKVLETKLINAGLKFDKCTDILVMEKLNINEVPCLEIEGKLLDFKGAIEYINKLEVK